MRRGAPKRLARRRRRRRLALVRRDFIRLKSVPAWSSTNQHLQSDPITESCCFDFPTLSHFRPSFETCPD